MLILTRRVGESLVIGDDVIMKVLKVRPTQVSIGVTAPSEVRVLRAEVNARQPGGSPGQTSTLKVRKITSNVPEKD